MAERITTLLQDRLPLDPDRRLKVPAIRPEDDMVTVRRRLGRYLYDSLAKDTDRETLAVGTANMIWPGCEPVDRETDAEIARDLRRTESKTGSPAIALHHPAGRIIIISGSARTNPCWRESTTGTVSRSAPWTRSACRACWRPA